MTKHTTNHLAAIQSNAVTKTNVIGLRKILNTQWRRVRGYSVGSTAPLYTNGAVRALEFALSAKEPMVIDAALHASGVKLLTNKRYRKRLAEVRDVIDSLECFKLVRFDRIGDHEQYVTPVYRACGLAGDFLFRNIPWQSGGNGPEILES